MTAPLAAWADALISEQRFGAWTTSVKRDDESGRVYCVMDAAFTEGEAVISLSAVFAAGRQSVIAVVEAPGANAARPPVLVIDGGRITRDAARVADAPDGGLSMWTGEGAAEALRLIRDAATLAVAIRGIGVWAVDLDGARDAAEAFDRCRLTRFD